MNKIFTVNLITLLLIGLLSSVCCAQPVSNRQYQTLEKSIDSLLEPGDIVGFSACIIKENDIVWSMSRGKADIENNIPVTENTVYELASLSKTVTGAAIMHLNEKGLFTLDEDVNRYLPFHIQNPFFPDVPITFRMLLTHTSSLTDVWSYIGELYGSGDQNSISLGEVIKNCYDTAGKHYSAENFSKYKPGDNWKYCNSNYVLIAYLVERISKRSFSEYTKENLFTPLEMNETSWFYSGLDTTHIAVPYQADTADEKKTVRIGHYSWPGYADGCLKTSVPQYAHFIEMLLNKGSYKGRQILKPETVSSILTPQTVKIPPYKIIPPMLDMGLAWMVTKNDSVKYFMHGGEGDGITTLAFFNPSTKSGAIMFLTGTYLKETGAYAQKPKRYTSILFPLLSDHIN
jgi:CubicO group peptidase (beta-lactamase class C family)